MTRFRRLPLLALLVILSQSGPVFAGMWAVPGESNLRADLTLLADSGHFDASLSTWPIACANIERMIAAQTAADLSPAESAALARVQSWLAAQRHAGVAATSYVAATGRPATFRTFDATPRERGELGVAADWQGEHAFVNLQATVVGSPKDGQHVRPDGTYIGLPVASWYLSAGWLERWWGPGHDGSLILSTNARPMPGISLDRATSVPFESRWLHWLGPWTYSMFLSEMEGGRRDVSHALFFGQRLTINPFTGIEFGFSRTAQFCGSGRRCNLDILKNMLVGSDNRGDNVSARDEPGNQMAGFDARWTPARRLPFALYAQMIGEDQQGGMPFKNLGLLGAESWKGLSSGAQLRAHVEFADTACSWYRAQPIFGCAYGESVFDVEGYRYRGRSIGDSIDADGRAISTGLDLVDRHGVHWSALVRRIDLDRGGTVNPNNQASPVPLRVSLAELRYARATVIGKVTLGVGFADSYDKLAERESRAGEGFLQIEHQFGPGGT